MKQIPQNNYDVEKLLYQQIALLIEKSTQENTRCDEIVKYTSSIVELTGALTRIQSV